MPAGITTTVGRVPIPFGSYGDFGVTRQWSRSRRSDRSRFAGFAGSSELVSIARKALERYQNAIDVADQACEEHSGTFQRVFEFLTQNTFTASICSAAKQMHVNYDNYSNYVNDPNTPDDKIIEIIAFINQEIDIRDLVDLASSTRAGHVLTQAALDVPGTLLGGLPWWIYAGGAVALAFAFGWKPLKR